MLWILLGLLAVALPLASIVGLVLVLSGRQRLDSVEARLRSIEGSLGALRPRLENGAPSAAPEQPRVEAAIVKPVEAAVPLVPAPPSSPVGPASVSLEQRIGTRWSVWVGGLALSLGGLLMVRHALQEGWLGPGVRVALGFLLAAALTGAGEWLRRNESKSDLAGFPSAHIPSVLMASGTVTAFATIYAAHALYGFIGPALAFVLLAATGLGAMIGSALYGPALAGLGLAGSFATPLLVASDASNPWPVVVFIGVVSAAAFGLSRLRRWLWLAIAAVAGAIGWGLIFLLTAPPETAWTWPHAAMAHTAIQLALAAVFLALVPHLATSDQDAEPDWVAAAALAALTALAILILADTRVAPLWPIFALAAIAIPALTAWRSPPASTAAVLAGLVGLAVTVVWALAPIVVEPVQLPLPTNDIGVPVLDIPTPLPGEVKLHLAWGAAAVILVAVMAALRHLSGPALRLPAAAPYAIAATVPPLLVLIVTYLRVTEFDRSVFFALAATSLGLLFTAGTERFLRHEASAPTLALRLGTGALAAAAIAALSLALVFALDRGYLTVAFALAALGTALVARRLDIPSLRFAVIGLGLVVAARLAWDPRIMGSELGQVPILNWLLLGYGVPAACFWAAADQLRGRADDVAVRICEALAVLFAALLVYFQIRHGLNAGDPLLADSGHVEQGLFALTGLGFAYGLRRLDLTRSNPVFQVAALIFSGLSGLAAAIGLGLAFNPLLTDEMVTGRPIISSLLLAYALPAVFAAFVASEVRKTGPAWYAIAVGGFAAALAFGYVSLEVRHLFQGPQIGLAGHPTGDTERVATSIAWVLLGCGLLGYGLWRGALAARIASAVIIVLAVIKVFVFDLSGVEGIWRALSFIGLGLALVAIGLVYQRLIFGHAAEAASTAQPDRA